MSKQQKNEETKPKIGAGHAAAMLRTGSQEMAKILAAFPDGIQPIEDPGLFGNKTQRELHEDKHKSSEHDKAHENDFEMDMDR